MPTEARDLKSTVIETDNDKNNLKQAKKNIDNKLVELGGDASTNIFNVPEKIENTINTQYKKIAIVNMDIRISSQSKKITTFKLPEVDFKPSRILIIFLKCKPPVSMSNISSFTDKIGVLDSENLPSREIELEKKRSVSVAEYTSTDWRHYSLDIVDAKINDDNTISLEASSDVYADWDTSAQFIAIN